MADSIDADRCGVCHDLITLGDWAINKDDYWVHGRCVAAWPHKMTYTQLRMVCRACNLHFIVCTERPETHGLSTMYCPECGQDVARFIMYEATVPGFIFQSVPGEAKINDLKL